MLNLTITVKNASTLQAGTITLPAENDIIHNFLDGIGIMACGDETENIGWGSSYRGLDEYLGVNEESSLFDLSEALEALEDGIDNWDAFEAACYYFGNFEDAYNTVSEEAYRVYEGCYNMTAVAEQAVEELGLLDHVPETVARYFDFEAYGDDLDIEGQFVFYDGNYYEFFL